VDVSPLADSADGRYSSSSMDQKKGEWRLIVGVGESAEN
jgi:hypothetical protein